MKILKAIGGVFVKIWRWIKNTAWVQPLLIVGVIFGVIFSIPAISSGIQGLINGANSADTFYHNFQKSMEGDKTSAADVLIKNYNKYDDSEENIIIPENEQKYFLMFTSSNNAETKEIKAGFETLRANWGPDSVYAPRQSGEKFQLYTIFTDEITTSTTPNENAFSKFLGRNYSFFETASGVGFDSDYYLNKKITDDDLNNLATPSPDNFKIPTIFLVDWSAKINPDHSVTPDKSAGITQVLFDVPGDTPNAKASLLFDCWNCEGDFTSKK
ncbi:MAG: hypothetical protein MJ213_05605 [Bacilli bacterium]|nr:hypothetical protein [Bacilli bacterium]